MAWQVGHLALKLSGRPNWEHAHFFSAGWDAEMHKVQLAENKKMPPRLNQSDILNEEDRF